MNVMKKHAGKFDALLLALFVTVAPAIQCAGSPGSEKTRADAQAAVEKVKATVVDVVKESKVAVKQGTQRVQEWAMNWTHDIKLGMQRASVMATNITAKVKVVVINTSDEVKEKVKRTTQ